MKLIAVLINKATTGIYFSIFFEIRPKRGTTKEKAKGIPIKSDGFTILIPLFWSHSKFYCARKL